MIQKLVKGPVVQAEFRLNHIDRMPLGDISGTIYTLIHFHPEVDFVIPIGTMTGNLFWIRGR